jgi:HK97 family phage portal protein
MRLGCEAVGLFSRSIRPPDETPNANDPATVQPATVGPPTATAGDPHGVTIEPVDVAPPTGPPIITPDSWSGWPSGWSPPNWSGTIQSLTDTAWMCVDLNTSILSTMDPYLVDASPSLDSGWLTNPDPDHYVSWADFAKQLWWDYYLGEAFVLCTARYQTGWPARFHVVPPWYVSISLQDGLRRYMIGALDVTADILHIRYQATIIDLHGHGPLEVGAGKLIAGELLSRYATGLVSQGGIPASVLEVPESLNPSQAGMLRDQWVQARISNLGEPAVLSGGATWKPTQMNPRDMALTDLQAWNDARIALLLGVPPILVGLPSGSDPQTYKNVTMLFAYHWRAHLRPKAETVMDALSGWALPRSTTVELDTDSYVAPEPLERAQTYQIYNQIRDDPAGPPVMTVAQIQDAERLADNG